MSASSPGLVIGAGGSGSLKIGNADLGCIVGDFSDDMSLNMQTYSTLCDSTDGYEQATPGALTRNVSVTVEFIVGQTGIAAAVTAIKAKSLETITRTFTGQDGTSTDTDNLKAFVTQVRKSVSPGAATGQAQIALRVVEDA